LQQYHPETGRSDVIEDWPSWWDGVQRIGNAIRRDYYVWLMLSGCRARETMIMETGHVDLDKAVVKFPVTKTSAFTMPISTLMVDLLRNRIADNAKEFGDDCKWVFPSATSETGHLAEAKLTRAEAKLFKNSWSAHVLRHSWITNANEKVGISDHHQRLLTNHAPKRGKRDSHSGYIHPDLEGLRRSQQLMSDYLLAQIRPAHAMPPARR
jgi:integrase